MYNIYIYIYLYLCICIIYIAVYYIYIIVFHYYLTHFFCTSKSIKNKYNLVAKRDRIILFTVYLYP